MGIAKMNRAELEVEILQNDSLLARFDQKRLYASGYSDAEYREIIGKWIMDGDECAGC